MDWVIYAPLAFSNETNNPSASMESFFRKSYEQMGGLYVDGATTNSTGVLLRQSTSAPAGTRIVDFLISGLGDLRRLRLNSRLVLAPAEGSTSISKEIENHLRRLFELYSDKRTASPDEIEAMLATELSLNPYRKIYSAYINIRTQSPQLFLRLFDASPKIQFVPGDAQLFPGDRSPPRLPIEIAYPHLQLPERTKDGNQAYLMELGRFGKWPEVESDALSVVQSLALTFGIRHPRLLQSTKQPDYKATIYVEALAPAARYYKRFGFQVAYRPEDLPMNPKGLRPYILKIDAREFLQRFFALPSFPTLRQTPVGK